MEMDYENENDSSEDDKLLIDDKNESMNSTCNTRLSDLHNSTVRSEDSEEDLPLVGLFFF